MKKIINFVSILMCAFLVFSCGEDETENPYAKKSSITIEKADVEFQCVPSQGTIQCSSPNGITRVESSTSWCTASASGNTVTVNVEQNLDRASRAAKLKIYSGNDYAEVTVQQMGITFCVNNGNDLNASAAPMTHDLVVAYTGNKNYTVAPSEVDWATFRLEDGILHVTLKVNPNKASRSTVAKLTDGESTTEIKILQNGLSFIVNDGNSYLANDGATTKELAIEATPGITYTVAPSSVDWATFSIKDGALVVKLNANNTGDTRQTTATITYAGELTYNVKIYQCEIEKDMLGDYTFYYGTNGTSKVDVKLQNDGGDYYLVFDQGAIPISMTLGDSENPKLKFNNLDFVGNWKTSSVTTDQAIVLLMYTNGSSIYRTSNKTSVSLDGTSSFDLSAGAITWNLVGTAPSGYTFYALRVANTSAGTYATITSTNITAFNYPSKLVKK